MVKVTTSSRTRPISALTFFPQCICLKDAVARWSPSDREAKEPAEEIFVQPGLASFSTGTKLVLRRADGEEVNRAAVKPVPTGKKHVRTVTYVSGSHKEKVYRSDSLVSCPPYSHCRPTVSAPPAPLPWVRSSTWLCLGSSSR